MLSPAGIDRNLDALVKANLDDGLCFYQQPIVNSSNFEVVGYEHLVRKHSLDQVEGAPQVLKQAELFSMTALLDFCALNQGIKFALSHPYVFHTINVHISTLCNTAWLDRFCLCIGKLSNNMLIKNMVIEITETDAVEDIGELRLASSQLMKHGMQFGVDDFGDGYACLEIMRNIPIRVVKFSRSALLSLSEKSVCHAYRVHQSLIHSCITEGLKVVAEGVETLEQQAIALDLGVDCLQGFRYGKPARIL